MARTLKIQMDADEAKRLEAAVDECITQMRQANLRMEDRQAQIDQLKADTQVMLNSIRQLRAVRH